MAQAKRKRDPQLLDVFYMRPRGRRGPKVIVYRDSRGRFIEVMKVDKDVSGVNVGKSRKRKRRGMRRKS